MHNRFFKAFLSVKKVTHRKLSKLLFPLLRVILIYTYAKLTDKYQAGYSQLSQGKINIQRDVNVLFTARKEYKY